MIHFQENVGRGQKTTPRLGRKTSQLRGEDSKDLEAGRAMRKKKPESLKHCWRENCPTRNTALLMSKKKCIILSLQNWGAGMFVSYPNTFDST